MINYKILDDSVKFYESKGFARVEVPWAVTKAVADITRPANAGEFKLVHEDNKVLVASAEQSFLYQYAKGFLPKGKFQAITPCFRKDSFDAIHTKYFIKNELIDTENVTEDGLQEMIHSAQLFLIGVTKSKVDVFKTGDMSYDIMFRGVELGSYGIRSCDFLTWVYGTGAAEPRLSQVIGSVKRNNGMV